MHRSGTSALTRVLNLCGAGLPPGKLLPPNDENEDGFWESEPLVHLHDEILAACRMAWNSTRGFPPAWFGSDLALSFQTRIFDFIQPALADHPVLVIKDPRLCHLVPLWRGLAERNEIDLSIVIPLRNPLEVAASLERRDGMPRAHALLLWLRHFLQAEHDTRDLSRCFVSYDALTHDGLATARALARILPVDLDDREAVIAAFVNPERRHHHAEPEALAGVDAASGWVSAAYEWACQAALGEIAAPDILDEIHAALHAAEMIYRPGLDDDAIRIDALTARVAELEQQALVSIEAAVAAVPSPEICPERYMA